MSETNTDTSPHSISHIPGLIPGAHPPGVAQAGSILRRAPMSQEQRRKLSLAQNAYVASDPRWAEHRRKLADAQIARRMSLTPEEFDMVMKMRAKGRNVGGATALSLAAPRPRSWRR